MTNPSPRMTTKEAAQFLTEFGFKTAPSTLGKRACLGGGPEFEKWGNLRLYTPEKLIEWAESRLKKCE